MSEVATARRQVAPPLPADLAPVVDRVLARSVLNPETGCLEWQGYRDSKGYGRIYAEGRMVRVHRVMLAHRAGDRPNMETDHRCWNPACVNPEHLNWCTRAENNQNQSSARSGQAAGMRGVYRNKNSRKYHGAVWADGVKHAKYGFDSPQDAAAWAASKREELFPYITAMGGAK